MVNALATGRPTRSRTSIARLMAKGWVSGVLLTAGAGCTVEGLGHIHGDGPYFAMSNHRSHMDTPLLMESLPFLFGFMAKLELM
jgi:1-acyl-sn-glycerol-3-phosphate acyltransferase